MSVYAISDLHGMRELFDYVKEILQPDDIVYCLGDCADRGPDGFNLIKEILSDKRFIYLKGNHEQMLSDAILETFSDYQTGEKLSLLSYNGGYGTYDNWMCDGMKREYAGILRRLPEKATYINQSGYTIILSHAGFTPDDEDKDLIWNRNHFYAPWPEGYEKTIIVHGHTPIPNLINELDRMKRFGVNIEVDGWENGAYYYSDNHKIDIDCGSFATGQTVLLDLDTFDEHIFEIPNFISNY